MGKFPKIREKLEEISKTFGEVIDNKNTSFKKIDYIEETLLKIVDSIENKKILDEISYKELSNMSPKIKNILDEMIEQIRLMSIYDTEPSVVNFNYNEYLKKIRTVLN
jgi:hypothetical protein